MSKHTPGPWKVNTQPEGTVVWLNGSAGYELRDPTGFGHKANPADARLIAAAPDLLEAAKAAAAFIAQRSRPGKSDPLADRTMATIQAALNKAEQGR